MKKPTRSVLKTSDLYANSERKTGSNCWFWLGAKGVDKAPRIWTLDYDRSEKRCMSGAKAVWYISQCCALDGRIAYRKCFRVDCVNPDHIGIVADKKELGKVMAAAGRHKSEAGVAARRRAVRIAHEKAGTKVTPPDVVQLIRTSPLTGVALSSLLGISQQNISRIRCGHSHKHLLEAA